MPLLRPVSPPKKVVDPVRVGRMPGYLTGGLGSLRSPVGEPFRLAAAGSLPGKVRGNFNNVADTPPIPYNSVGYTLVCRSTSNFTTILAIFHDYVSMSYTEEMSGPGAGSITYDRDTEVFRNQILVSDPDQLLEKDNLWEVYHDGERRFMWLGQNVDESQVNSDESRLITVSGPGLAASLDWAKVLPNRFPTPLPKIDTVRDDFIDQDVDVYGKWSDNQGTVQAASGRASLTVTAYGGLGSYIGTGNVYDFTESGTQALVFPYIPPAGSGRFRTHLRIEENVDSYVMMYVDKDSSNSNILVAEVSGPSGLSRLVVPYDVSTQNYWRIQEKDGTAIFSYRPLGTAESAWVQFAQLTYSFNPASVRLRLQCTAISGTGMTIPQKSYFTDVSVDGVASALVPFERFRRLIQKAQGRGTIKHIIPNWTASADSMGAAWVSDQSNEVTLGAGLMAVLDDFCTAQRADWMFTSDFRLDIRQKVFATSGPDPTAPFHKEDKVIFYETETQLSKKRSRAFGEVANYVVGSTESNVYSVKSDSGSISKFQQREALITDTLTLADKPSLDSVLTSHLAELKDGKTSWTVTVSNEVEGKQLYKDYSVGDWISIQSVDPYRLDTWRVMAVAVQVNEDGDAAVELTLNAKIDQFWMKIQKEIDRTKYRPPGRPLNPYFR